MQFITLLIYVLVCIGLIAMVLVQHGKGADMGAAFGAGASQTVFGSSGSGSFLMKLTGALAAIFFATSLILGHQMATQQKQVGFQLPIIQKKALPTVPSRSLNKASVNKVNVVPSKSVNTLPAKTNNK